MTRVLLAAAILVVVASPDMADGGGSAVIDFNGTSGTQIEVPCGAVGTWTVTYTVPRGGVAVGGGIRVHREPNRYWLGQCKQTDDPMAPDYVTAARSDGGRIEITEVGKQFKAHAEAQVRILTTPMQAGSRIVLKFGDTSGGSIGAIVPFSWQPPAVYHVESDEDGDGELKPLAKPLVIRPVAGPAAKLVIDLPLVVKVGEKARLNIRAEDKGSNVARTFAGEVILDCTDADAECPKRIKFGRRDRGVKSATVTFKTPGIHYVSARAADVVAFGCSNPSKVTESEPEYRIYWGDLHCHTEESDGTGSLDFNYQYGRDTSWLDFMAVTDHLSWDEENTLRVACEGTLRRTVDQWNDLQSAAAKRYNAPGKFVTFLGYEWSGAVENGGDHNFYYVDDTSRAKGCSNLDDEYKDLRSRGKRSAFVTPHVGGRCAQPDRHDPALEPELEINSMHGHFEWFAQQYLQEGYKMGFIGSSDGHFGRPGNDIWPCHGRMGLARRCVSVPQGATCICAAELTREALRDAIFARRTYATTGVKMLLDVTVDRHMMGDEYSSAFTPRMHILAAGTGEIGRIEVIRNQQRIFNKETQGKVVELDFEDKGPVEGTSYYYVRVSQNDGEIAWSSPIFFTYTGAPIEAAVDPVPWNYECEADELGDPVDVSYLPQLREHLKWRAPGRFYALRQVRIVRNPRGNYALFYGRDRANKGAPIHIRWYPGFDSFRLHVSQGWRDFGSIR